MLTAFLQHKIEERAGLADLVTLTLEKCAAENRDPSTEERSQLDGWEVRCKSLDDEIGKLEAQFRGNERFEQLVGRMQRTEEGAEQRAAGRQQRIETRERPKSIGEQFVDSDAFKDYHGRGSMAPVEIEGFLEQRDAIDLEWLGDRLEPQRVRGPADPVILTPLLSVLTRIPVSRNNVAYEKWGMAPEAGGPIPEGELKPEAEFEWETIEAALGTYAHWKAITRQALEDDAQIRGIVEGLLRRGLTRRLERGAGEVLAASTVPTRSDTDLSAGIRRAIADLQDIGMLPNAVGVNPQDYAEMDIAAAAASNSGPTRFGSFWNLGNTIPIPALPRGQAYVGDFATAMAWYDRNNTAVYMTDSHADYFLRNKLVILAEQRATFDVVDASALVKVVATEAEAPIETTTAKASSSSK